MPSPFGPPATVDKTVTFPPGATTTTEILTTEILLNGGAQNRTVVVSGAIWLPVDANIFVPGEGNYRVHTSELLLTPGIATIRVGAAKV